MITLFRRFLLAGGPLLIGVWFLLPAGLERNALYAVVGALSVAANAVAARHWRSWPWALFAAGQACAVAGDLLWLYYENIAHIDPFPSPADGFYLAEYPLLTLALLLLSRRHRTADDHLARLDSTMLVAGLALPYWVLLIAPALAGGDSTLGTLIGLGYPLGDVLLLAGVVRLLLVAGTRNTSFRLITLAVLTLLTADVTFTFAENTTLGTMAFLASYLFWGVGALVPSAGSIGDPAPRPQVLTRRRLVVLTGAVLLSPGILIVQLLAGLEPSTWAVALTSAALFVLVVTRMAGMVRRLEEQAGQLEIQARRLDELARTDTLTGLPNRRTLDAQIVRDMDSTTARRTPFPVAMLDLDHFKRYNDTHGHQTGDDLLAGAARSWSLLLRDGDTLARYGGEEFVLLMPGRTEEDAARLLDRLRIATPDLQTFSAGLAVWDGTEPPDVLMRRADLALYAAKEAGRGRVVRAAPARPAAHPLQ
ncbi:diguanylate cyclase (GGDEF)-like protein [Catenuloplanes nepalensis]|uniref:Diguanylate cyclase (GGDEF)-like protein n=1 Tax=Catenuloplanes nepalensis TaxID=587533 RepID=A0ABT9MV89_9ACTN|nr:GGDEF domain-containing protein [Catenuloplanes nepalensis]MDP9795367.1 diguanylate cyclase (GGDEF)-like protein [Catenuloplanes nepalensis]